MGIRLLERAHKQGFMPVEQAVHRLTGELAQWYGLDAAFQLAQGRGQGEWITGEFGAGLICLVLA